MGEEHRLFNFLCSRRRGFWDCYGRAQRRHDELVEVAMVAIGGGFELVKDDPVIDEMGCDGLWIVFVMDWAVV
ncbi:hypothetical protein M0R45_006834 [Rubus argutus]|uniref:Uncharacterized protein n=1 Tax=Rubus argutus TaxID=59490 RepID=A0AAW1YRP1_RUBAR